MAQNKVLVYKALPEANPVAGKHIVVEQADFVSI